MQNLGLTCLLLALIAYGVQQLAPHQLVKIVAGILAILAGVLLLLGV